MMFPIKLMASTCIEVKQGTRPHPGGVIFIYLLPLDDDGGDDDADGDGDGDGDDGDLAHRTHISFPVLCLQM